MEDQRLLKRLRDGQAEEQRSMRVTSSCHDRFSKTWHETSRLARRRDRRRGRGIPSGYFFTTLRNRYEEAIHHVVVVAIAIGVPVERNLDVRPVDIDREMRSRGGR